MNNASSTNVETEAPGGEVFTAGISDVHTLSPKRIVREFPFLIFGAPGWGVPDTGPRPSGRTGVNLQAIPGRLHIRGGHSTIATSDDLSTGGVADADAPATSVVPAEVKEQGETMVDQPSREEMNARIEAAEARIEGRIVELRGEVRGVDSKLDRLGDRMTVRIDALGHQMEQMLEALRREREEGLAEERRLRDEVGSSLTAAREEAAEASRWTRNIVVGSAIGVAGVVLASILAAAAMVMTSYGNSISSLQTGVAIGEALRPDRAPGGQ